MPVRRTVGRGVQKVAAATGTATAAATSGATGGTFGRARAERECIVDRGGDASDARFHLETRLHWPEMLPPKGVRDSSQFAVQSTRQCSQTRQSANELREMFTMSRG